MAVVGTPEDFQLQRPSQCKHVEERVWYETCHDLAMQDVCLFIVAFSALLRRSASRCSLTSTFRPSSLAVQVRCHSTGEDHGSDDDDDTAEPLKGRTS